MSGGIAVIGMACRYPDANCPEALWQTVLARRRAFRRMPAERLSMADYDQAQCDAADAIYPIQVGVLEDYAFDRARHFVPAAAFAAADMTHWLALDVATEALEEAGLSGGGTHRDRTGVVVGNTLTGEFSRAGLLRYRWPYVRRQLELALVEEGFGAARRSAFLAGLEARYKAPFPPPDEESLAGGLSNTIAGRIANHHDLHGGGYTVDAACASSLLAVTSACQRLASGELDMALAGGVDLSLDPFELVGFARNGALSKTEMRVFDRRSDGFWPGEGCGFVLLMRESQALAEGRPIRGVIRGWGLSSDGQGGLTRPTAAGQALALERAYAAAGFDAGTVPLFEAHGTGTSVGDAIEIAAIAGVRRAAGARLPAALGSIKANIGHTKAAAGLAGLIKQVMALDRQILPAATACDEPHPALQEQAAFVTTLAESRAWPVDLPLRAGVSALGFGGINIHLALEARADTRRAALGTQARRQIRSDQDAELFAFAAEDRLALRDHVASFAALAPSLSRAEMADAAAALTARRGTGQARAMVVAASPAELARRLGLLLDRLDGPAATMLDPAEAIAFGHGGAPRILFLFPGQAAPANLSGGAWRRRFESVAALYSAEGLPAAADTAATEIAQPAITLAARAGLAVLAALGVTGTAAIGHSLGELPALHWAGAYDGPALQRLATGRGKAMAAHCLGGGSMLLLLAPPEAAERLIAGRDAVIACYNSPRECVVAGARPDLALIEAQARAEGLGAQPLAVSHAFHSRFAAPAAACVEALAAQEPIGAVGQPVFSTVTGRRLGPQDDVRALLGRQVAAPVRFAQAWAAAAPAADLAIEVGPGHGLTRLAGGLAAAIGGPPAIALDAGGASLAGLLTAAGAAFVLGAPVALEKLFDDRFTRPFDLDRPRRFLANPCESAAAPAADAMRPPATPIITRQPAAVPKIVGQEIASQTPLAALRSHLARRLDLAEDAIRPDHRLFADLHLNSISVGQIIGQTARALGLSPPAAPSNYALATVREAAAALSMGAQIPQDASDVFPAGVDSWVRAFVPGQQLRPLIVAADRGAWHWRIVAAEAHGLARRLAEDSRADGHPAILLCLPGAPDAGHLPLILDAGRAALERGGDALLLIAQSGGGGGGGGAAFARCLALEHPALRVVVVDLPFDDPRAAMWLSNEARAARPGYAESRYDADGRRFVPTLEVLRDLEAVPAAIVLGPQDVLLVSGGGGGIGAECALAAARRSGARIAVIGRSRVDAAAVQATMARFRAAGIEAGYESADIGDPAAVARAVGDLSRRLGPVTALLHAAGINRPAPLASLGLAELQETVSVKLTGLRNLMAATDPARLKLVVGFSSIIARIGLPGEAHYAVANAWLGQEIEAFAASHPRCRCLALEWSVWAGIGMGERLGAVEGLGRLGVAALPAALATDIFETLIERPPASVTMVVAGRFGTPSTVELRRGGRPAGRFLERTVLDYPGVEIVAESRLEHAADPYLEEHALAGAALFPAVLGLEAMVQAAAALADGIVPEALEAVEFRRPVVVGTDGAGLRVAALLRDPGRVDMVLRAEESGYQLDHFKAVARFGARAGGPPTAVVPDPDSAAIALDREVLYDQLLFHRGRFRRILGYQALSATGCIARIGRVDAPRWFPQRPADDLRLGDPAIRDAALHALQACIPHRRVLPVAVERIRLGRLESGRAYTAHGRERRREGDRFTFDLEIRDSDGCLAEHWQGLELQAIEALAAPRHWTPALLGPVLERRLDEVLPGLGIRIRLDQDATSDDLFAALLGPGRPVCRRADGRPEADQPVSAAHAGRLVLAATAADPVGCDIEPVEPRTAADWRDLLGERHWSLACALAEAQPQRPEAAGTRIWAALEALKKAGASPSQAPLVMDRIVDDWAVLTSGHYQVATWAGAIDTMPANAIVIAVAAAPAASVRREGGLRPQRAYSYRHVIGFGDTNLVGNVYFAHFIEWQGRCREMFLRDKAPSVVADLAAGLSLVTTHCSCEFLQELRAFDEVRLDMRLKGAGENRVELAFEYWCRRDGADELVARGEQGIACLWAEKTGKPRHAIPRALVAALQPYAKGPIAGLFLDDGPYPDAAAHHRMSGAAE